MALIGKYHVSSCNKNDKFGSPSACRVKLNGVLLAEVFTPHADPLRWIRTRPRDDARKQFVEQLLEMNVSQEDIDMLLAMPEKV